MLNIFEKDEDSKYDFISGKDFILIILLCLLITIIIPAFIMAVYKPFEYLIRTNLYLFLALAINLYVIYYFCCKKRGKSFKEGLFFISKPFEVYRNCLLVGIIMPIVTSPILMHVAPKDFYAKQELQAGHIFVLLVTAVIVPFFEEILYRSFLFSFLQTKLNSFFAIALTGILFGVSHMANVGSVGIILSLFIFYGMVITFIRFYTKSVIPSLITHVTHNLTLIVGFLLMTLIKG